MLLLAHTGHWALWVLYGVPVLVVLGSIAISVARDRRQQRAAAEAGDAKPQAGDF